MLEMKCSSQWSWIQDPNAGSHSTNSESVNQMAISREAEGPESAPWIRLRPGTWPKSPRMVPIAAFKGFVAPIIDLATLTASWPCQHMQMTGPELM